MRLPCVRLTVQRLMALVFVIGAVIGGTIELDRATRRRAAYLALAYRAEWRGERYRSNWQACLAQVADIRAWVASGAQGHPPGEIGEEGGRQFGYILGASEAESWRRNPKLAMALAERLEEMADVSSRMATDLARDRQAYERAARFPRVLFSPAPPEPE